jgi:hypothetical protein
MGKKEIYQIPMPLLLLIFLEKYQFNLTNVTTGEFIEDLLTIAKSKLYNVSGGVDYEELFRTLRATRIIIDHNSSQEITYMADVVTNEILSLLVLHNIHNKLYYVVKITPSSVYLQTYDDHIHSPTHSPTAVG